MEKKYPHIAKVISRYRKMKGYTPKQLNLDLGWPEYGMIYHIERAKSSLPPEKIAQAAHLLNISQECIIEAMSKDYTENITTISKKTILSF